MTKIDLQLYQTEQQVTKLWLEIVSNYSFETLSSSEEMSHFDSDRTR